MRPAVSASIRLDAFRRNLEAIRRRVPQGTPLCPAVKANAYGHGVDVLLPVLQETGVESLCVAQLEEAAHLRQLGWRRPVLCLGAPTVGESDIDSRERALESITHDVECTVCTQRELDQLGWAAQSSDRPVRVHIKVDTGMGRMGVAVQEAATLVHEAARRRGIQIAGVYTHFATADEPDLDFAREQLAALQSLADRLRPAGCAIERFHAANSAAIFRLPEAALDMVRPGLSIYGYWGGPVDDRPGDLEPILKLASRLVAIRKVPPGTSIGYGRSFVAERDSLIGVVPVGYADGYRRALGGVGIVTVEGRRGKPRLRAPVVGRVSMDMISVDLTDVPDVEPGDAITIYDTDPAAPNSVEAIARQLGTIPYEITCSVGPRVVKLEG